VTAAAPLAATEPALTRRPLAVLAAAGGCVLLVARPPLLTWSGHPVLALGVVFSALLAVGWAWPASTPAASPPRRRALAALALGLAAFAAGRLLGGGEAPVAPLGRLLVLNSLAALAEEAFFRRLLYAALLPAGAVAAVAGSAALFALVHVSVYGAWVLPLDLAAGLLLSWQRWATGSWRVPALTHVLANVLVVI
jgi:membrane protease YdiL (CAAX protease family)